MTDDVLPVGTEHESTESERPGMPAARVEPQTEAGRILILSQNEPAAQVLQATLQTGGFAGVEVVTDARMALPAFRDLQPDAVLLDPDLDQLDTLSLMSMIAARARQDEFLPFVVLTNGRAVELRQRALDARLTAFFQDPADPLAVMLLARELIGIRARTFRLVEAARQREEDSRRVELEVARRLIRCAELKDHPLSGHTERVGRLSSLVALALGMSQEAVDAIRLGAMLHDVGKVGIPDAILLKEEPLTLEEMDVVKMHTTIGASILAGSTTPLFQLAEEIALYHHENWDGTGYTPGLERESIPLVGRIVRVTDTFDAMTQARPFAEPWHSESALDFIRSQAGRKFDPSVVDAFLEVQPEALEPTAAV